MNEEKEKTEEPTPTDVGEGDKPQANSPIEQARDERKKTEEVLKALKEENDRAEKLQVEKELGGTAEAGSAPLKKAKRSDEEFVDAVMAGEAKIF